VRQPAAFVQRLDLHLFRNRDVVLVQPEHLRWLDRDLCGGLHRSQQLLRHLRRLVRTQLHFRVHVHSDSGPERQRVVLGQLDLPHHLHRNVLSRVLDRLDLRPEMRDGQLAKADSPRRHMLRDPITL
jgi:hypothetical protein